MNTPRETVIDSDVLHAIVTALRARARTVRAAAIADGVTVLDREPVVFSKTSEAVRRLRVASDLEALADTLEVLGAP